ncbi:MAG: HAMP domain-containing sensor histidine kinase [Lachnospiraceae bacterium]|nr:HAMP domain-containing sensor histidine kinase [Lachnospiraceae bacterium]
MLRKLQWKFLQISMAAFAVVVVLLTGMLNLFYIMQMENQSNYLLEFLVENGGRFPRNIAKDSDFARGFNGFSQETPYETRYFSVELDDSGVAIRSELGSIAAVSDAEALDYVMRAECTGDTRGYLDSYKFAVKEQENSVLYVFLDCHFTHRMELSFVVSSVMIAGASLGLVLVLMILLSGKAVAPLAASIEKQKRFITDAGHELKTPLAIISANNEVIEMTSGENEWTESTRHQIVRLSDLIQNMLVLSRLQEEPEQQLAEQVDLSSLVEEETNPFASVARSKGRKLEIEIQKGICCKGNENSLRQLVTILIDNAVKYADEGGTVQVAFSAKRKECELKITNPYANASEEEMKKVFQRFYRTDQSRSRETGGSGIGLSIATLITELHKGKIWAEVPAQNVVCFHVVLPGETQSRRLSV